MTPASENDCPDSELQQFAGEATSQIVFPPIAAGTAEEARVRRALFQGRRGVHTATAGQDRSPCQHPQQIDLPIAEWTIARRQEQRPSIPDRPDQVCPALPRDGENTGLEKVPGSGTVWAGARPSAPRPQRRPGARQQSPSRAPNTDTVWTARFRAACSPTPRKTVAPPERSELGRFPGQSKREPSHRPTSTPLESVAASARDALSHCTVTCKSLKGGRCST